MSPLFVLEYALASLVKCLVGLKILDESPQNDFYAIEFIFEYGLSPIDSVAFHQLFRFLIPSLKTQLTISAAGDI